MATWRLARSLEALRSAANKAAPKRSKLSDGTIGDAAHSSRTSDHNPNKAGVVQGMDLTHDPAGGLDSYWLAEQLLLSRDPRIKYVISNGKIASGAGGKSPWKWRPYTGANKHNHHVHISVKDAPNQYDSTAPWAIDWKSRGKVTEKDAVLKNGSSGPFVMELQRNLVTLGFDLKVDGHFGDKTETDLRVFQKMNGLEVDGWAGPRTLDAIGKAIAAKQAAPKIAAAKQEVPEKAKTEVKKKTGLVARIMGLFGSGGLLAGLFGAQWQTVLAIAGSALVAIILIYIMRHRLLSAYEEANKRLG